MEFYKNFISFCGVVLPVCVAQFDWQSDKIKVLAFLQKKKKGYTKLVHATTLEKDWIESREGWKWEQKDESESREGYV